MLWSAPWHVVLSVGACHNTRTTLLRALHTSQQRALSKWDSEHITRLCLTALELQLLPGLLRPSVH